MTEPVGPRIISLDRRISALRAQLISMTAAKKEARISVEEQIARGDFTSYPQSEGWDEYEATLDEPPTEADYEVVKSLEDRIQGNKDRIAKLRSANEKLQLELSRQRLKIKLKPRIITKAEKIRRLEKAGSLAEVDANIAISAVIEQIKQLELEREPLIVEHSRLMEAGPQHD